MPAPLFWVFEATEEAFLRLFDITTSRRGDETCYLM
jgi:hypothetical protein